MATRRIAALPVWLAALLVVATHAQAASRYDPSLRFRVLSTPHFLIYYHQGEEAIAKRFAPLAERVHEELTRRLASTPRGRTHVILVDQNDTANGWATPLPYDTIEITVAPPAPREVIGNTDEWLRLVFTHEYTHILHLDRSRGFASVFRHVFGRSPIAFPNLFLPPWQTEGLATYEESARTGLGRVNAGDFGSYVRQAARERRAWGLDRATSDFDDWPSGNAPYAYGAFFHQYLVDRYGEAKLAELAERTSGRFYFLSTPAFKRVYGKSLGTLWQEYLQQQQASMPTATGARAARITSQGFIVTGPRFARDASGRVQLLYSSRTSHDFPRLMMAPIDRLPSRAGDGSPASTSSIPVTTLASRYHGDVVSVVAGGALFDQQDLRRSVAIRSDLYALDVVSGRVHRLTYDARLLDPDVAPDGRAIAAVALRNGQRTLAVFELPAGAWPHDVARLRAALSGRPRLVLNSEGMEFASPRWSPDGRLIAVAARTGDGPSGISVVDADTGRTSVVVPSANSRNVSPAWTPDGRTLLFASDRRQTSRDVQPFNIYATDLDVAPDGSIRADAMFQVTNLATGATYPDVGAVDAAGGLQLAYVGYTASGYDVFMRPLERSAWTPVSRVGSPGFSTATPESAVGSPGFSQPTPDGYRPWSTVLPRYWIPAFDYADQQLKIGAQTGGSDVLGRHLYSATALVRVAGNAGAPGSRRYDWAAGYVYDRWVPAFFASASDRTHFLQDVRLERGEVVPADLREQNEEVGVTVPDAHVRYAHAVTASLIVQRQSINFGGLAARALDRNGLRVAWAFNSAKVYGYSISPEQGVTIGVTGEFVRRGLGAAGTADAGTVDARGYTRLGGHHTILAARAVFGASRGDAQVQRVFFLGGNGPNADPASFGSDAFNLLRGFSQNEFAGLRLASMNAEYRIPLVRVERGFGTFPVFLRTLQALVFADAGKTWTGAFAEMPFASSVGAELAGSFRLGYELPITAAAGIAWPRDPFGTNRRVAGYFRVGYAF